MSEYLDEAVWREHYRDLIGGLRTIREAVEALGPLAPLPPPEYMPSRLQECECLAVAIVSYSKETRKRITQLEKERNALKEQIALTSRTSVEEIIDEVPEHLPSAATTTVRAIAADASVSRTRGHSGIEPRGSH